VALNLLLNITAGLMGREDAIRLTRWGWLLLLLYATYLLLTEKSVKGAAVRLHTKRGGLGVLSYIVVALLGATLAVIYWAAINRVYARMFRVQAASTQVTPSALTAQPPPTTTPLPQPTPQPRQTESAKIDNSQPAHQAQSQRTRRKKPTPNDTEDILLGRKKGPSVK
jgi:outer membrane biosynthesis protein TonB